VRLIGRIAEERNVSIDDLPRLAAESDRDTSWSSEALAVLIGLLVLFIIVARSARAAARRSGARPRRPGPW